MSCRSAPGADQIGVDVKAGEELFGDLADELAVVVHRLEGFAGRGVIAMQGTDLAVGRDPHQPVRWSCRTGPRRSIKVARSTEATGSRLTR